MTADGSPGAGPAGAVRLLRDASAFIARVEGDIEGLLGWSAEDLIGRPSTDFIHPQDQPSAVTAWMGMIDDPGRPSRWRGRYRSSTGEWVWVQTVNTNRLDDPDEACVLTLMHPVAEGELGIEEQLRAREQLLHRLTDALPVGVVHFDVDRTVLSTNERLHDILGHRDAVTVGRLFADVVESDRAVLEEAIGSALAEVDMDDVEVRLESPAGPPTVSCVSLRCLTDENGRVAGAIATVADVTERVELRRRLEHSAATDDLTGCLNRRAIRTALASLLAGLDGRGPGVAVAFVDLDGFKQINDNHGHHAGDHVLVSVAERLGQQVRHNDLVGRVGGDEFLVVCPDIEGADGLANLESRLLDAFARPVEIDGTAIAVAASVGLSRATEPVDVDVVISAADAAMYERKPRLPWGRSSTTGDGDGKAASAG